MKTTGNTVLITGGGSGIGLSIAQRFLKEKNRVIICDLKEEILASARDQFPDLEAFPCDVTLSGSREGLFQNVLSKFPQLNILVNNAGISLRHHFLDPEPDLQERALLEINTNLFAPVELTRMFLPHLLKQDNAAIINMSSGLAYVPMSDWPVYCATKAGIHSFSQCLRFQLKGTSVRVLDVLPSWVDTAMVKDVDTRKISPDQVSSEIMRGLGQDRDEIHVGLTGILYFMSRLAPRFMFKQLNDNAPALKS